MKKLIVVYLFLGLMVSSKNMVSAITCVDNVDGICTVKQRVPTVTKCIPRPKCLDLTPPCKIRESENYCPNETPTKIYCKNDDNCSDGEICYQPPMPRCGEGKAGEEKACVQVMPTKYCVLRVTPSRPTPTPRYDCRDIQPQCLVAPCPTMTVCTELPIPTPTVYVDKSGDANGDGKVNLVDFDIWKKEYLKIYITKKADFDKNGSVNLVDFSIWKRGYLNISVSPIPVLSCVPRPACLDAVPACTMPELESYCPKITTTVIPVTTVIGVMSPVPLETIY